MCLAFFFFIGSWNINIWSSLFYFMFELSRCLWRTIKWQMRSEKSSERQLNSNDICSPAPATCSTSLDHGRPCMSSSRSWRRHRDDVILWVPAGPSHTDPAAAMWPLLGRGTGACAGLCPSPWHASPWAAPCWCSPCRSWCPRSIWWASCGCSSPPEKFQVIVNFTIYDRFLKYLQIDIRNQE